jgi:hypothetical protein
MAVILPISNRNCWSVRLTPLTPPCEEDHVISSRIWITDIALNHDGKNHVRLGVQIRGVFILIKKPPLPLPLYFWQPRIINDLANRYGLRDIRRMERNLEYWKKG